MKLYLAHPFRLRKSIREWELEIEATFPTVKLLNPFYDIERSDVERIDKGKIKRSDCSAHDIVERDLAALRTCDGVLAIIDNDGHSFGVTMEIVYARLYNIPVYLIIDNQEDWEHPWLREHSNQRFHTFLGFECWLMENKNVSR